MDEKLKNDITEFIKKLRDPQPLYDALLTYSHCGVCSLIPFTNLTFLVTFGIMEEKGTNKERLKNIINFLGLE